MSRFWPLWIRRAVCRVMNHRWAEKRDKRFCLRCRRRQELSDEWFRGPVWVDVGESG